MPQSALGLRQVRPLAPSESVGLPPWLLAEHPSATWGIPTSGGVRSLNLSNAVAIVLYEALRRTGTLATR